DVGVNKATRALFKQVKTPGQMVELLGPHALLDELAAAAGSIAHECLVRLGGRAEQVYRGQA
ncbi:MAG TPA: hypothetical protein PKB04_12765, partial [Phenylobacterium sp.]|nr:hypothetical protein [Phenylobacterium sp.]